MNLEIKDKEKIEKFVEKYRKLDKRIKEMEFMLERITTEKDLLVSDLENTRQEEISFMGDLTAKYGDKEIVELLKQMTC